MRKSIKLIKKLEGLHTLDTMQKLLGVSKKTAIKEISLLRKEGFVKTFGGGKQPRLYLLSTTPRREIGYPGLYETINRYSPIKIREQFTHKIINRKLSVEEALIRAVVTKDIRTIMASLGLFNHVSNWKRLYRYSKEFGVRRKIVALYDIARISLKVKKMDLRIRKRLLESDEKEKFIIPNMKTKDFKSIERTWRIHIPLNKADMEAYKEWSR